MVEHFWGRKKGTLQSEETKAKIGVAVKEAYERKKKELISNEKKE